MKNTSVLLGVLLTGVVWPLETAQPAEPFDRRVLRVDMGGVTPGDASLRNLNGPASGEEFKLGPGFQFDLSGLLGGVLKNEFASGKGSEKNAAGNPWQALEAN